MNHFLVSIIIPVFNDHSGLTRCIEAISLQSYPLDNLEIVVVDNASDPPISIKNDKNLNIKVIYCDKPGSYAARNAGVKITSGDFLAFTDADCRPDKDWITSGVMAIKQHAGKAFIGGEGKIVKPPKPSSVALYQHLTGFRQKENIAEKKFTAALNLFCTRELFLTVGFFDERLLSGGDSEWSWRALAKGFSIFYEPSAVVYTDPRTTLRGAIRQARRVTAGRIMLNKLRLAHMGKQNIAKRTTSWQSAAWILSRKKISFWDKLRILHVALIIRLSESIERIRLALGARAERR